jgi:hypothetical protein
VNEWHYPGIAAALREDADVVMPIITIYEWGQEKNTGAHAATPEVAELSWASAEVISADDISREEILDGAFGK